ncbi:Xaa-Pro aminopeptidase [Ligilactobacillus salitolerans]|uniref:Xaa-Pro aminopeptidase n=1 Tax=Ligilactobacillus salitolerans TaxID=1808352 RepID=A0A401IU79_9LACO|nr:aminopeptidase P family protein [Ligilactobacillus salitolerans]GBG95065.1 Xaa-Pro aminopeptidase [Ligilactobacillus salitolerans]
MTMPRVANLRSKLAELKIDGFLVTDPLNIKYLSGFTGDAGVLLITENQQYLITDSRFEEQVKVETPDWQTVITRNYLGSACDLAQKASLAAIGFEDSIDYASYDFLDETAVCDIVAFNGVVESLRSVKDENEIAALKESCRLADQGFDFVLSHLAAGQTELDVSNDLDYFMKKHGASERSFETIVASGEHTTWPHGTATTREIKNGDLITLDYGYFYAGYTSDVTRTFSLGQQNQQVKEIYQVVLEAQQATIAAVRAGVSGAQIDQIGRSLIQKAGYGEYFNHGMGHGIGLDIHELPNVGTRYPDVMQAGQIVTVEPGIYVLGLGGVRIEDDVLVTATGSEILTNSNKQFIEI